MVRQPSWDPDFCVRRAITASQVPSPIGRLVRSNVPNWPTPQAIVSLGSRFYTHIPCVLLFQGEPHVPLVVEALPWETPGHLIRFAPPHMGLIGATACWVNGFPAECQHRIPPYADWIELRVTALTASEARICAAAFARLPPGSEPRIPHSWQQAGYFPYHDFLAGTFADALGPSGTDILAISEHSSESPSEDCFSSSHSGSPDCARASGLARPRRSQVGLGESLPAAAVASQDVPDGGCSGAQASGPPRRWNRRHLSSELAGIAVTIDVGECEMTVFDALVHVRVLIGDCSALMGDPVQFALDKSHHLPAGYTSRILRYGIEGYPCPQVVLFEAGKELERTAPVDLQGEVRRICTLSFPVRASIFELSLLMEQACETPSTLRFQVARRHVQVEVNGVRVPRFEADSLLDADAVQFLNVKEHWTPRDRPDIVALMASSQTFTPELLLPLQVLRSFSHPVTSAVVHRTGQPTGFVSFDPCMRPAVLRAHVLSSLGCLDSGLLKLPLLSPHFEGQHPHFIVLDKAEFQHHRYWAIFDVRRLHGPDNAPFFLAPVPAQASVGYLLQMIHERIPGLGPLAGIFHNHVWMSDVWRPLDAVSLLTVIPQGANLLDHSPAVYHTLDLLETNLGYQSAFCRYEVSSALGSSHVTAAFTTTSTTWALESDSGRMAINPDPVREGPAVRDPRDHVICLVASPQCLPGAFTFHSSVDLPELPARALHYVTRHAFVSHMPVVRFSPVVYRTLARIPMLFATVGAELEPDVYIWIDPLPGIPYPLFRQVGPLAALDDVLSLAGLEWHGPAFATVNGQIWAGDARNFAFGDVVQVRSRLDALFAFSLDSLRFNIAHCPLLHRPVFGPEMRCLNSDLQTCPAMAYRRFTREVLYTHFRGIYTAWARELILRPGSSVMFVGPGLPPFRACSGASGQPVLEAAQALYDSLFGRSVGVRLVQSMDMQLSGAWLFAAVPEDATGEFEFCSFRQQRLSAAASPGHGALANPPLHHFWQCRRCGSHV